MPPPGRKTPVFLPPEAVPVVDGEPLPGGFIFFEISLDV